MKEINWEKIRQDICFEAELRGDQFRFCTTWGLFSPEKIDEGSRLLLKKVIINESDNILDLGCGYGVLGVVAAKKARQGRVTMVDKDFVAVDYAKRNAGINGINNCDIFLSNGFAQIPTELRFDLIVSNLPAKVSKELYWIMFADAFERLNKGGRLVVVVIAGLKEFIKRNFKNFFGNYKRLAYKNGYMVFQAIKE